MLVASNKRRALMTETPAGVDPDLSELVSSLALENIDLVLVEGFRHLTFPKIELHRPSTRKELLYPPGQGIIAIASDQPVDTGALPLLDINRPQEITEFILNWLKTISA